jgi:hypothetical protein
VPRDLRGLTVRRRGRVGIADIRGGSRPAAAVPRRERDQQRRVRRLAWRQRKEGDVDYYVLTVVFMIIGVAIDWPTLGTERYLSGDGALVG